MDRTYVAGNSHRECFGHAACLLRPEECADGEDHQHAAGDRPGSELQLRLARAEGGAALQRRPRVEGTGSAGRVPR